MYLNGKPQNMPFATLPSDDGNPNDAYYPYRDDFPAVPPPPDSDVTATWSVDLPSHIQNGNLVVPPGDYFAMGDNRLVSLDSRYWGFVPRQNILGRPLFVYWSFITSEDQVNKTSTVGSCWRLWDMSCFTSSTKHGGGEPSIAFNDFAEAFMKNPGTPAENISRPGSFSWRHLRCWCSRLWCLHSSTSIDSGTVLCSRSAPAWIALSTPTRSS